MIRKLTLVILIALPVLINAQNTQNFGNTFIYHEACDGASVFGTYVTKQNPMAHSITQTTCYAYNGTKCAKFELRNTDTMNNSGTRSEITFPTTTNLNRWYSFAILFPCEAWAYDTDDEVITQWHQGGGLTPALCLRTMKDSIYLRVVTTPGGDDTWYNLGKIQKDMWHEYVMHIQHSSSGSGLVEIWRNDIKIMNLVGANMYPVGVNGTTNPNVKMGLYKSGWNDDGTTMTNRRVIYFDDIKYGNESSSFREMKPRRDF